MLKDRYHETVALELNQRHHGAVAWGLRLGESVDFSVLKETCRSGCFFIVFVKG